MKTRELPQIKCSFYSAIIKALLIIIILLSNNVQYLHIFIPISYTEIGEK